MDITRGIAMISVDRDWGEGWSLVTFTLHLGPWSLSLVFDVSHS